MYLPLRLIYDSRNIPLCQFKLTFQVNLIKQLTRVPDTAIRQWMRSENTAIKKIYPMKQIHGVHQMSFLQALSIAMRSSACYNKLRKNRSVRKIKSLYEISLLPGIS